MSTDQHSALKKLTGGPPPCISVKLVDKEHVQKHLDLVQKLLGQVKVDGLQ